MLLSIRKFFEKRGLDGQAIIEYALILMLVAIAVIVMLRAMGGTTNNQFNAVNNALRLGGS